MLNMYSMFTTLYFILFFAMLNLFPCLVIVLSLSICLLLVSGSKDVYAEGPWRKSLDGEGACWTDRSCQRVLTTAHGGEWNVTFPYDSMPAFNQAYLDGADAIKGDFRVAKDNIGVVMHSSPVEIYESFNCHGKYVEEMTSAECSQCQMEITDYRFQTVPDLLSWAENKINVMFCVKESKDIPRAITTLLENNASHRAFLELHTDDFLALEGNKTPSWDEVYYVVELKSHDDYSKMMLATEAQRKRGFMLEFNDWDTWDNIESDVAAAEALGYRTFAPTRANPIGATVEDHLRLYNTGVDVAYTYNLTNAVQARIEVNKKHRITPP